MGDGRGGRGDSCGRDGDDGGRDSNNRSVNFHGYNSFKKAGKENQDWHKEKVRLLSSEDRTDICRLLVNDRMHRFIRSMLRKHTLGKISLLASLKKKMTVFHVSF